MTIQSPPPLYFVCVCNSKLCVIRSHWLETQRCYKAGTKTPVISHPPPVWQSVTLLSSSSSSSSSSSFPLRLLLQNKDSRNVYCHLTCLISLSCLIVIFMFNYNRCWRRYGHGIGFISKNVFHFKYVFVRCCVCCNCIISCSSPSVILEALRSRDLWAVKGPPEWRFQHRQHFLKNNWK